VIASRPTQFAGSSGLSLGQPRPAHGALKVAPRAAGEKAPVVVLPPLMGASRTEIRKRVSRFTALFLIDDSGSMYGFWGDQLSGRYAAARSLLELLRRSGGGRAGVVHYGSCAPTELTLQPRKIASDREEILRALTAPATLGGTNVAAALERAHVLAPPPNDAALATAYFIVSDGIEPVTPAIQTGVHKLGRSRVHLLLVDRAGGCTPHMETAWRALSLGSFTRLKTFDTKLMAEQLAQVAASTLDLKTSKETTTKEQA
jgi:hypothetical protein